MNLNGRPVPFLLRSLGSSFPLESPPTLIALHDNLTIPPLTLGKLRHGVSHQGHGGLSSIESSLKTKDFWRMGLGIGRGSGGGVVNWVMSELTIAEKTFWERQGADEVGMVVREMVERLRQGDTGKVKVKKHRSRDSKTP
jgi:PTH1 family peptidyl-tRNA hydrolase